MVQLMRLQLPSPPLLQRSLPVHPSCPSVCTKPTLDVSTTSRSLCAPAVTETFPIPKLSASLVEPSKSLTASWTFIETCKLKTAVAANPKEDSSKLLLYYSSRVSKKAEAKKPRPDFD